MSDRYRDDLPRDLYVLEDESNPNTSKMDTVWPKTILDQVFDQLSPEKKNLREIIADLRQEIITGGRGTIVFPVTSVNGMTDDVIITPETIGLGNVDNTSDKDKPLSDIQRETIMNILQDYDFEMNLEDLYKHLTDNNNPHGVTIDQLNLNDTLEAFILRLIDIHNLSTKNTVHTDIRRSLSTLWNYVDDLHNTLEDRLEGTLGTAALHYDDPQAHINLFDKKENVSNKLSTMLDDSRVTYETYPSSRALVDYMDYRLDHFKSTLPDIHDWIDDITVIDSRDDIPEASVKYHRKMYIIRKGVTSHDEIAICRKNTNGTYSWDYSTLGTYTKYNSNHFIDSINGMSINMPTVVSEILNSDNMARELGKAVESAFPGFLNNYYSKEDIDGFGMITKITMIPGTSHGSIRFYVNDDESTMSDDIRVAGLQRLAYLEWVTENELWDQSVHENHIISRAIARRHLQDKIVLPRHMACSYNTIIGNTIDASGNSANEITLEELADKLVTILRSKLGL